MQDPSQSRLTVGDRTTIVSRIAVPTGTMVQVRVPEDSGLVTLNGTPQVTREGDSVRISWPVTVWQAGSQQLVIPGPILIGLGAPPDTLPDLLIPIQVASLLPTGVPSESIAPQSGQQWIPATHHSMRPLLTLVPVTLMLLLLLHWWWRRHGSWPPPETFPEPEPLSQTILEQWLDAGEGQLALRHLQAVMQGEQRYQDWLARAAEIQYAVVDHSNLVALVHEGWSLLNRVES